jgi:hypothetical protein
MRTFKLIGALIVVLAFSAVAVATASAAETLWTWLPGSAGETFKGTSGEAVLSAKDEGKTLTVKCKKSTLLLSDTVEGKEVHSELLKEGSIEGKDATLALMIIHFEGCLALGLAANSPGDTKEIILVHVEEHNCMIEPKDFGVLLKILPLHIEIPSLKGVLILVEGSVIGLLEGKEGEKLLTFKLNLKTNAAKEQEFLKCSGGEKDELKASLDGVKFEPATEEAKTGTLEFDMTKDTAGEEMMEK